MAGFSPQTGRRGPYESELAKFHFQRIKMDQPADERLPNSHKQFYRFDGLNHTDYAGQHAKHPAFAQLGTIPGGGGSDTSSGNRGLKVRRKDCALPLKPENGSVDIRFSEKNTDIIRKIARRKIIRPIDYEVIGFDNLTSVLAAKHGVVQGVHVGIGVFDAISGAVKFLRPTSFVPCSTWRCKLEKSTMSKSTKPRVPTPAAAR